MDNNLIQKLRRFALAIGIILFAYSSAGVELKSPAEIAPLGIPLVIKNTNFIGIAILTASIYAFLRYLYYSILIGPSPGAVRARLKKGIMPNGSRLSVDASSAAFSKYHDALHVEFNNAFPRVKEYEAKIEKFSFSADGVEVEVKIPWQVEFFCLLADFDYYLPLLVNGFACLTYVVLRLI